MTEQIAKPCPFCQMLIGEIKREFLFEGDAFFAILSVPCLMPGHVLIIPKRHVASIFDFNETERQEFFSALHVGRAFLETNFCPDGYNVGINDGIAGGQTVMHQHTHLFPRRKNDIANPRGGIVNFLPPPLEWLEYIARGVGRFIKASPYGTEITINPRTENMRELECLCFNCAKLNTTPKCRIAAVYYNLGMANNTLAMITGCQQFEEKPKTE